MTMLPYKVILQDDQSTQAHIKHPSNSPTPPMSSQATVLDQINSLLHIPVYPGAHSHLMVKTTNNPHLRKQDGMAISLFCTLREMTWVTKGTKLTKFTQVPGGAKLTKCLCRSGVLPLVTSTCPNEQHIQYFVRYFI